MCWRQGTEDKVFLALATMMLFSIWRWKHGPQCRKSFAKEMIPAHIENIPKNETEGRGYSVQRKREGKKRGDLLKNN